MTLKNVKNTHNLKIGLKLQSNKIQKQKKLLDKFFS